MKKEIKKRLDEIEKIQKRTKKRLDAIIKILKFNQFIPDDLDVDDET